MTHQCPGPGCAEQVDSSRLMCPACWPQVPKPVRRALWIAWHRGPRADTPTHRAAVRLAVAAIRREIIPASSLKHPACGPALESAPQAGLVSSHEPGGSLR
jgi:hypothetical protein